MDIKELRKRTGLSQEQFAEKYGMPQDFAKLGTGQS